MAFNRFFEPNGTQSRVLSTHDYAKPDLPMRGVTMHGE
jgi:hypothetical protein